LKLESRKKKKTVECIHFSNFHFQKTGITIHKQEHYISYCDKVIKKKKRK